MVIYNYAQYIKDLFPGESVFVNVASRDNNELPDRFVIIEELPGTETPVFTFSRKPVQFTIRDIDPVRAYKLAWSLFDALAGCYHIDLPAVTVAGTTYPIVTIEAVNPGNKPYNLGPDSERRKRFLFTLNLLYVRRS